MKLPSAPPRPLGLRLRSGWMADFFALAPFHYRAGPPATVDRILTIADGADAPIAVLVSSHPVLNAQWRSTIWPRRFIRGNPRQRARELSRSLRCISRVIVDPRYRGLGLACLLVRRFLRTCRVRFVEAPAAMGRWCPFFTAAGMTAHHLPPSRRDARLLAALRSRGIADPASLLHSPTRRRLSRSAPLHRALIRWADASRATRIHKHDPPGALLLLAARTLHPSRTVFAWSRRKA